MNYVDPYADADNRHIDYADLINTFLHLEFDKLVGPSGVADHGFVCVERYPAGDVVMRSKSTHSEFSEHGAPVLLYKEASNKMYRVRHIIPEILAFSNKIVNDCPAQVQIITSTELDDMVSDLDWLKPFVEDEDAWN
jgi:hypothetical protein